MFLLARVPRQKLILILAGLNLREANILNPLNAAGKKSRQRGAVSQWTKSMLASKRAEFGDLKVCGQIC